MKEKGDSRMKDSKRMFMIGLLLIWMIFTFMGIDSEAKSNVYYGHVVATEGKAI